MHVPQHIFGDMSSNDAQTAAGHAWFIAGVIISTVILGVCIVCPLLYQAWLWVRFRLDPAHASVLQRTVASDVPLRPVDRDSLALLPQSDAKFAAWHHWPQPHLHALMVAPSSLRSVRHSLLETLFVFLVAAMCAVLDYFASRVTDTSSLAFMAICNVFLSSAVVYLFEPVLWQQRLLWVIDSQQRTMTLWVQPYLQPHFLRSKIPLFADSAGAASRFADQLDLRGLDQIVERALVPGRVDLSVVLCAYAPPGENALFSVNLFQSEFEKPYRLRVCNVTSQSDAQRFGQALMQFVQASVLQASIRTDSSEQNLVPPDPAHLLQIESATHMDISSEHKTSSELDLSENVGQQLDRIGARVPAEAESAGVGFVQDPQPARTFQYVCLDQQV